MPHSPTPSLSCGLPASPAEPSLLPQQAPHPPDHPAPCTSCWAVFVTSFLPLQMLFQLPGMHPPTHTHTCFNSWVCPCDLFRKPSLHPLCGCFCEAPCTVHCTQPVPAPPGSPPDSAAGDGPAPGQLCLAGLCPPRGPGPGPRTQKDAGKGSTRRNPSHGKGMPCCPQTGRWPPGSAIFTSPPAEPRLARQVLQLSQ